MSCRYCIAAVVAFVVVAMDQEPLLAQPADAASQIYRLKDGSTFQEGCFGPCACPLTQEMPVIGTFRLTFDHADPLFDYYTVTDVNWTVWWFDPPKRITGSGSYRIGGEVAVVQQLELDLHVGGDPVQHFDSGLVAAGAGFPAIDVTITINNMFCYDRVIHVVAAPVPAGAVHPYRVAANSTYQKGCFDPCDCVLWEPQPLAGRFALIELSSNPLFAYYGVVDVKWRVKAPSPLGPNDAAFPITGSGIYQIGGEVAAQQRMILDLSVNGAPLETFDSGLVIGGGNFPKIDVLLSVNGMVCYDQVIDLHAKPANTVAPTPALKANSPPP